jgi:hypothetical protein
MRSDPPPLLPILRSRTQAGVLTVLLLNPDLELTQTELARRVGASLSSVVDEVRRLEQAGLLSSRTLGRARLVRAGSGPLVGRRGWRRRGAGWRRPRPSLSMTQSRRLSSLMTPPGSSAKRYWRSRVCDPLRPVGTSRSATPCAPSLTGR